MTNHFIGRCADKMINIFMLLNFVKIFYILICWDISFGIKRGDNCDGGVCELVTQCPTALQNIKKGVYPKICGFEGSDPEPNVCCPDVQQRIPTQSSDDDDNKDGIRFPYGKPKARISKTKCGEYAIKTCAGSLAVSEKEMDEYAHPKKFPHVALIGYGQFPEVYWKCSGSLISESYILTAARCEYTSLGYAQWARLGISYKDFRDYDIIQRLIHPHYHDPYAHDDIALFKLNEKVKFDLHVHPICLHDPEIFKEDRLFSVGFEKEKCSISSDCHLEESDEFQTDVMTTAESKIDDQEKCAKLFYKHEELGEVTDTEFTCVHLTGLQINKCQGMIGDGLLYKVETGCPSFYNLVGILSVVGHWPNEYECHFLNTTVLYTKTSHYLSWIEQNIWKHG